MIHKNIGSSFDDFLDQQEVLAESEAIALKRVFAWEMEKAIEAHHWTKTETAKRMKTSRAGLERLLDPSNTSVTLKNLEKAAVAVGKRISIEMTDMVV